MTELDLTAMADEIAANIWDARQMQHMLGPYSELKRDLQNKIKEDILPVMFHAIPVVEKFIEAKFAKDSKALDEIADRVALDDDGMWTDESGILESVAYTVKATGREVEGF